MTTPKPSDLAHQALRSVRDEYRAEFTETYGLAIGDVTEIHAHMMTVTPDDERAAAILTLAVVMATPEDGDVA
ncbi:hypothetical protein [Corynebacterium cystitidis]|uniref:hypothetical protein n=1 Tax=Corynebacterium cystitidis TaxID=35757 RepID=UPI00211E5AFA|nr:hypothetical protein [Corynebacterium cystitidis]